MSVFEVGMMICFGMSWPVSIAKALKTKVVAGKSPAFMGIVIVGYISGVMHKIFFSLDWVILLYIVNLLMVSLDLMLYFKYSKNTKVAMQ